jgi:hypothetical protein
MFFSMARQPTAPEDSMRSRDSSFFTPPSGNTSLPELPAERAFVVQFRAPAPRHAFQVAGRIEHVVSGRAGRFDSWEELRGFVEDVLQGRRSR